MLIISAPSTCPRSDSGLSGQPWSMATSTRRSAAVGRSRSEFGALCRLSSRGVQAADLSARADTGRRAKDLLDEGRVRFLREHALSSEAVPLLSFRGEQDASEGRGGSDRCCDLIVFRV